MAADVARPARHQYRHVVRLPPRACRAASNRRPKRFRFDSGPARQATPEARPYWDGARAVRGARDRPFPVPAAAGATETPPAPLSGTATLTVRAGPLSSEPDPPPLLSRFRLPR
jgi:hypothetical protein